MRKTLQWFGLAIAFAVALRPPLLVLTGRARLPSNDISIVEAAFARLSRELPPDASVGWLVPRDVPAGLSKYMTVSQYALVPRRFANVSTIDCASRGRDACGASRLDFLFVADSPRLSLVSDALQLGFAVTRRQGEPILVARRVR